MSRPNVAPGTRTNVNARSNFAANVDRGRNAASAARPNWYHGDWHDNWDHPWHNRPAAWLAAGYVIGAALHGRHDPLELGLLALL